MSTWAGFVKQLNMTDEKTTSPKLLKAIKISIISLVVIAVILFVGYKIWESTWVEKTSWTEEETFLYGSTGTELVPLVVFQVLPDLFPEHFQPAGQGAGDWTSQFGFIPATDGVYNQNLPLGMFVSNYQPGSGKPSPIKFVGFNCAICHTSKIMRFEGDTGVVIYGMGSSSIDLVAFGDALKSSFLDEERLTMEAIEETYKTKYQRGLGFIQKMGVRRWLKGVREALVASFPLRDAPFGGKDLRNADLFPSGPSRNQPMRESVRFLLNRTPTPDGGSSKIPPLYMQEHRKWAQFDGSLGDPQTRNSLAALGVGANLENLRTAGILRTIRETSSYVAKLPGPSYLEVFKDLGVTINKQSAARGEEVYMQYCMDCHGRPDPQSGSWIHGKRHNEVVPVVELKTDPARVSFRYYREMGDIIYGFFPQGHPLKPKKEDLRAGLPDHKKGYVNNPIESVFSRVPYLHNGSVLTLAELINLKPRRAVFYRGTNLYDPMDVGLVAPALPDDQHYFKFDTKVYGNSNKGHDYPWTYKGPGWNKEALKDLLEYLKTF